MAARRLVIVLVVMLGISALAAALAPVQRDRNATTETTTQPIAPPPIEEPGSGGRLLEATIDADSGRITVVPLGAGDELQLRVRSKLLDQISIPELGQVQAVSPDAAASFDLLLDEPGNYAVRLVDENRLVGRLEVSPAARRRTGRAKAVAPHAQP